jgi:hypothetical protein
MLPWLLGLPLLHLHITALIVQLTCSGICVAITAGFRLALFESE